MAADQPKRTRGARRAKTSEVAGSTSRKVRRTRKTTKAPLVVKPSVDVPTEEQIAVRAYELWQARGGEHGNAQQDWLKAERELLG